jgi:hypothetical protein
MGRALKRHKSVGSAPQVQPCSMRIHSIAIDEEIMCLDDNSSVRVVDVGRSTRPKWLRSAFGWHRQEPHTAMRNNVLRELGSAIKANRTRTHLNNHSTVI